MTLTKPSARPVVVRCDGSAVSQDAVAAATRQAARYRAPLALLATHAEPSHQRTGAPSPLQPAPADDPKSIAERAWWRANHTDPSVAVQIMTVADLHSQRLNQLASRARLFVVGGADVLAPSSTAWGSTARALDRLFRCPVLLAGPSVKADDHRRPAVVVGFSGAPQDAELMPPALAEAELRGWDVVVVRAVASAEELEPAMDETWAALNGHCREIPCRVVHLVAKPAAALADQAAPGDLLVIGSRGSSPVGHLTQDSVGGATVRRSRCDVLVLPVTGRPTRSGPGERSLSSPAFEYR
ncbi:universal stress protein [Segeticoccus rhizosphaerae]|uniref:universal stress protein n=1 Tax=Segeticoccus rhizosphaerae TaxID=1104777 RepID=UPI001396B683|nr:universal stress protein [Segeticoccus rhizosphaerae]